MGERTKGTRRWFPFKLAEFEVALALLGTLLTALSLAGASRELMAASGLAFVAVAYLAGLLVSARSKQPHFRFLENAGVGGRGYLDPVRSARVSLLLQHVDDDAPSPELLGLYRTQLERGVLMRRLIFLRPDARPEGLAWVREFGQHPNLEQRVVLPDQAQLMRWSFVVVDEREVVISMPGVLATDAPTYSTAVVLRHVMVLGEASVAQAFVRIHEHIWKSALPVEDLEPFGDVEALRQRLRASTPTRGAAPRGPGACSEIPPGRRRP